jgi:hypothetical protein
MDSPAKTSPRSETRVPERQHLAGWRLALNKNRGGIAP